MSSHGMTSLVNIATRPISSSCLDHLFIRQNVQSRVGCIAFVHNFDLVDHCSVGFYFKAKIEPSSSNNEIFKLDLNAFCLAVKNEQWSSVFASNDVDIAMACFIDILNVHISNHRRSILVKKKDYLKPWINHGLKQKIAYKNDLYLKHKKHPNNKKLESRYLKFKRLLIYDVDNAKKQYYENLFSKHNSDTKKQWQLIGEVIGDKKNSCVKIRINNDNGLELSDPIAVASEFNKYFVSVSSQLCESIGNVNCLEEERNKLVYSNYFESKSCFFEFVSRSEIESLINSLKNSNSLTCDIVSNVTLKMIKEWVSSPLQHIFNLSLSTGTFPDILKKAVVIPLFKSGQLNNKSNYRPISLLSVFSKLLEKVVKKRIINFFSCTGFFSELQFGFREKLSTEDALLKFFDYLMEGLNNNLKCAGLFVDITKAFDTVNHDLLLEKLRRCGLRGVPLSWFKSYLLNRRQCIKVENVLSTELKLKSGVPQGSVLGPILFTVYINSLCKLNTFGKLVAFADDTAFVYNSESWTDVQIKLNSDLNLLQKWFGLHYMVLSSKTKFMPFVLRNQQDLTDDALICHSTSCNRSQCSNN